MGPLSRGRSHQQAPPETGVAGFPTTAVAGPLWRAARLGPWWYCCALDCRFDLAEPRGTCYLGTDEVVGLLESLGPEIDNGVVASERLDQLKLYQWTPERPLSPADLTSRAAVGFGVTNELSTMTPYDIPQAWAAAFDSDAGYEGVYYRSRFDPSDTERAVAHFGPAGEAQRPKGRGRPVGVRLRARLERECNLRVAPRPSAAEVTTVELDW